MEKKGYVVKITKTKNRDRAVYGLSRHAKKLVTDYYEYLAGEKLIPVDKTNPYHGREDLNSHEKKVYDMMKKLKKSAG